MNKLPKPTDAELDILNVLWKIGPCTVREVHEQVSQSKDIGYTTILKQMQLMTDKGLLKRDSSSRSHIFDAAVSQEHTQKRLINRLLDTAFGGSSLKLVMQALGNRKSSPEEIQQIRDLLDRMEDK